MKIVKKAEKEYHILKVYIIEVNGNDVIVNGRDIKEKKWIFAKEIKQE